MRSLTAVESIRVWEAGQGLYPPARALLLAGVALPEKSSAELADFSLGARDSLLLELRERMFGENLSIFCQCSHCREDLELEMKTGDLRFLPTNSSQEYSLTLDDVEVTFRLPTTRDLLSALDMENYTTMYRGLLSGCITGLSRGDTPLRLEDLPEETLQNISNEMGERDPGAEILLNLSCPACQKDYSTCFDITQFLWLEIEQLAKRLLEEVHILANAYGWDETEILNLSFWRRKYYLERIEA